jgi:hypothetical protein
MSVGAISLNVTGSSSQAVATQQQNTSPAATVPTQEQATPQPGVDTVKLSGAALARSLKQQGQTVAQIALAMHLDVKSVDNFLGITTKGTSAPAQQATTQAEGGVAPAAGNAKVVVAAKG